MSKFKEIVLYCRQQYFKGSTASSLNQVVKKHKDKSYVCLICNKTCKQKSILDIHMKRHAGIKPFKCTYCEKAFVTKNMLNVHIRTHTNERPYMCDICGTAFKQNIDLKNHQRTHFGEKPFLCTICGMRMYSSGKHEELFICLF